MRITVDGRLADGVTAKDVILAIIGKIGTAGGTGHVIEFAGSPTEKAGREICYIAKKADRTIHKVRVDAMQQEGRQKEIQRRQQRR